MYVSPRRISAIIAATSPEKVFASVAGTKTLAAYYGLSDITAVKTGDSISLGKGNIAFVDTKMLHWPDSMVCYYDRDKVLFSQDAFGMHFATSKLFADENDKAKIRGTAFGKLMSDALMHVVNTNTKIDTIMFCYRDKKLGQMFKKFKVSQ